MIKTRLGVIGIATSALVAGTLAAPGAAAQSWHRPAVQPARAARAVSSPAKKWAANPALTRAALTKAAKIIWPAASTTTIEVTAGAATTSTGVSRAAGVTLSRSSSAQAGAVQVTSLGHAATLRAGVDGALYTLQPQTAARGTVRLQMSYASFAGAYGGDWAGRLTLVLMPGCAATTPTVPVCRTRTQLRDVTNDVATRVLSADVQLPASGTEESPAARTPMVVAATSGPSGSTGSFTASSLAASSSWQVSPQTGSFAWSYPLDAPPTQGGPTPSLAIGYNSSSLDGRTASSNNQGGWVGDGWSMDTGFIEREYAACSDDMSGGNNTVATGDLCWKSDNETIDFNGQSTQLVQDTSTGVWKLKNDNGSRLEKLTGASNGAQNGEYWRLTTTDGTQYYFGLEKRYSGDTGNTNSVWTVPVYGNQSGEPCHAATFAASSCSQAWRWNLDYVVDTNGNTLTYNYATETNSYERDVNSSTGVHDASSTPVSYVRGGYLTTIGYGQRKGSEASKPAPQQVTFTVAERCIVTKTETCQPTSLTASTAADWPDVPFDQICTSTSSCSNTSPTFFTRKMLTRVDTQIYSGSAYANVSTWVLAQQYLDPGDGTSKELWLSSITHTGDSITQNGVTSPAVTLPPVKFSGYQYANRVDNLTGPYMEKWRLTGLETESGEILSINYGGGNCTQSQVASLSPDADTLDCFPVYWQAAGQSQPTLDWFQKYVVSGVVDDSASGSELSQYTTYQYNGSPAWHHDDTSITPDKYRTWSDFRGYGTVDVVTGQSSTTQSDTRYLYMRGMNGDSQLNGTTRTVSVADSLGESIPDANPLNGQVREQTVHNGVSGAEVSGSINDFTSPVTATAGSVTANLTNISAVRSRADLAAGGTRKAETDTTYNKYGLPTLVNDQGDTSITTDDLCIRTTYAILDTTTGFLVDRPADVEKDSLKCATTPARPANVLAETRTYYDGSTTLAAAPTAGNATRVDVLNAWPAGGSATYVTTSKTSYDTNGRPLTVTDGDNRTTTTAYTQNTAGQVASTTVTDPMGFVTTTTLAPAWQTATTVLDPNGHETDVTYDGLGRVTAVWNPDRSKSGGQSADSTYSYVMSQSGPNVVTTNTLRNNGSYTATYSLYDGDLRQRQTITPAEGNPPSGELVSDTIYDSRGLVSQTDGPQYVSATYPTTAPTTVVVMNDGQVDSETRNTYDGAGRITAAAFYDDNTKMWQTATSYGGDRVTVTPPAGATPTTTVTDARGQTTALLQYHGATPSGANDETDYVRTPDELLAQTTDAAGSIWKTSYDLRRRAYSSTDPDRGTTTTAYDTAGQVTSTTDARNQTLAYTYDADGRKTAEYAGSTSGTKLASWNYDTLYGQTTTTAKGLPTYSTRYSGGSSYLQTVTGYDAMNRPTGTSTIIPSTEGTLAGTYTTATTYNIDGGANTHTEVAATGLPAETLSYTYDTLGKPLSAGGKGSGTIISATTYSPYGEPLQLTGGSYVGKSLFLDYTYQSGTRRLATQDIQHTNATAPDSSVTYTYDNAGNVLSKNDTTTGDDQCFTYDSLRRMTTAWTAASTCATTPTSPSDLGGPSPYWQSWTYSLSGERHTETDHASTSGQSDVTTTNNVPAANATPAHAPTSTTSTAGGTTALAYNAEGDTTQDGSATLTYDTEGKLATDTTAAGATSWIYDAAGNQLLRKDPTSTTLYLGDTELVLNTSTNAVTSTRYYSFAGQQVGFRTSGGLLWIALTDTDGTLLTAVDDYYTTIDRRYTLPFGANRTGSTALPVTRGIAGGTTDTSTGLSNLGAREYDTTAGRFLSPDPLLNPADPQQLNGYAYANNSPVTSADPTGLMPQYISPGSGSTPTSTPTELLDVNDTIFTSTDPAAVNTAYTGALAEIGHKFGKSGLHLFKSCAAGGRCGSSVAEGSMSWVLYRHLSEQSGISVDKTATIFARELSQRDLNYVSIDKAAPGFDEFADQDPVAAAGVLVAIGAGAGAVLSINETPSVGAGESDGSGNFAYRGGSRTLDNLTPRASDLEGEGPRGLSTWRSPAQALQGNRKAQKIDLDQLPEELRAIEGDDGHITITTTDPDALSDWADIRGTDGDNPLAQGIQDAITEEVRP